MPPYALPCGGRSGAGPDASWRWPEARWRQAVNRVRAGRALRPDTWPGGAQAAVALSFDVDQETLTLRDGKTSPARRDRFRQVRQYVLDLENPRTVARRWFWVGAGRRLELAICAGFGKYGRAGKRDRRSGIPQRRGKIIEGRFDHAFSQQEGSHHAT